MIRLIAILVLMASCAQATTAQQALDVLDSYNGVHASTHGRIAQVAVRLGDRARAKEAANWLVNNSQTSKGTGWGIGRKWDAFRSLEDNTENPPDTIYGITVGEAVAGLLDVYALIGKRKYLNTALDALDYYRQFFLGDFFAYSDSGYDNHEVYNVSARLAAQYARVGAACDIAEYRQIARKAIRRIHDARLGDHWDYSALRPGVNDVGHAAVIVAGIDAAREHVKVKMNMRPARRYMRNFVFNGTIREWPLGHPNHDEPARLGGYMSTVTILGDRSLIDGIKPYKVSKHAYAKLPGEANMSPNDQAWVAFGLLEETAAPALPCPKANGRRSKRRATL